jgi:antirestriction protein
MTHECPKGHHEDQEPGAESPARAEQQQRPGPRIYVASLADYNAGRLHGVWTEATQGAEQIEAEIASMLERSREPIAEEWAIHDYEGFGGVKLSEFESIERISRLAEGIADEGMAFATWISACSPSEETTDRFEEAFLGHFPSREAYAEHIVDDFGYQDLIDRAIPEYLAPYIRFDADSYARDIELNGDVTIADAPDGSIYVFDANV